jgi:hypothetical protein
LGFLIFLSTISYFTKNKSPIFIFIVPNRCPRGVPSKRDGGRTHEKRGGHIKSIIRGGEERAEGIERIVCVVCGVRRTEREREERKETQKRRAAPAPGSDRRSILSVSAAESQSRGGFPITKRGCTLTKLIAGFYKRMIGNAVVRICRKGRL